KLGASFGVSRTVIREALQRLEAQGLVQSRIGSGSYVAPYPMDQVKTVMQRFAALNQQADTFLNLLDVRIAQASGNPFFLTILEPLKNIGHAFGLATYESKAVIERICRDHRAILQAVTDGDIDISRRTMHDH